MPPRPSEKRRGPAPATHSIRLAAEMTGLSEETLRAWERRHGWPRPERTASGARLYTASDIARLKRVRRALDRGFRPGALLGLEDAELDAVLADAGVVDVSPTIAPNLDALLRAVASDDAEGVQEILRAALVLLGPRRFVVEIAQPASARVGELWASGELEVRHEHLLTAALESRLHVALATLESPRSTDSVLLTTLPGEAHALGLDMVAVYLATRGLVPRQLGPETPMDQIVAAARALRVRAVGVAVTSPRDVAETRAALGAIARSLRRSMGDDAPALWVGGARAADVRGAARSVRVVPDWDGLDRLVGSLSPR